MTIAHTTRTPPLNPQLRAAPPQGRVKPAHFGNIPLRSNWVTKMVSHPDFAAHLEDIVGFGVIRTVFNTFRMWFFDSVEEKDRKANLSATREWTIRELGNQFCANFLSGLSAVGLFAVVRKWQKNPHIADHFASNATLELFQSLAKDSPDKTAFVRGLSQTIAQAKPEEQARIHEIVSDTLAWMEQKAALAEDDAGFIKRLAKQLSPQDNATAERLETKMKALYEAVRNKQAVSLGETTVTVKKPEQFIEAISHAVNATPAQREQIVDYAFHPSENAAVRLAKLLDQPHFSIERIVGKETLSLNLQNLLDDAHQYFASIQTHMPEKPWQEAAQKMLENTQRLKRWVVPLALTVGMIGTMAVPYLNKTVTEKVDKIDDYVGEQGLRELKKIDQGQKKTWLEHAFPYPTREAKKGNWLPYIISLIPLPFALGMFNNGALHTGEWSKAFNNPLKAGFIKRAYNMFQFRQGFPFMTGHQLLALCALVCTARILTARDKIEMRERLVDSYGGWTIWAVGFGLMTKGLAKLIDSRMGTKLLEGNQRLPEEQIKHFLGNPELAKKTQQWAKRLRWWIATPILVFTVGIIEPYLALKWTEHQVRAEQKKEKVTGEAQKQPAIAAQPPTMTPPLHTVAVPAAAATAPPIVTPFVPPTWTNRPLVAWGSPIQTPSPESNPFMVYPPQYQPSLNRLVS